MKGGWFRIAEVYAGPKEDAAANVNTISSDCHAILRDESSFFALEVTANLRSDKRNRPLSSEPAI
jgi:hypothetical protein